MKKIILGFLLSCFSISIFAQPFIEPVNLNSQVFHSTYKDSLHRKNITADYNLSFFLPRKFENGNVFLVKIIAEKIASPFDSTPNSYLHAISMPIGFQFASKNKKWNSLFMAIPKIAGDNFKEDLSRNFQMGGIALITYVFTDSLKIKFGLFYNRECFGNFFVPLVGIDWKASDRWKIYGTLPSNMRVDYKLFKNFHTGIAFKDYTRSYRLGRDFNNDFVKAKEAEIKLFFDFYTRINIVAFADVGYSLNYSFLEYSNSDPKTLGMYNPVYSPLNNNFIATIGLAYRIPTE